MTELDELVKLFNAMLAATASRRDPDNREGDEVEISLFLASGRTVTISEAIARGPFISFIAFEGDQGGLLFVRPEDIREIRLTSPKPIDLGKIGFKNG